MTCSSPFSRLSAAPMVGTAGKSVFARHQDGDDWFTGIAGAYM
ncbi:protein of unknown function [Ralstonia solanacearum CMR15]|nr:protein of unknown function [Ralstonia solanacearum CMR15]